MIIGVGYMGFLNVTKGNKKANNNPVNQNYMNVSNNLYNDYDSVGMNGNTIKSEASIIEVCLKSVVEISVILAILIALLFIGTNIFNFQFVLFTKLDEYTLSSYNSEVRRSFVFLSVALLVVCFIVKIVINNAIRGRFSKKYLRKINIYIYDGFITIINIILYILIGVFFFYLVDEINIIIQNGYFVEEVNKGVIDIFKYVVVVVITIFGVLNSFTGMSIIHKKNKFVLEDYFTHETN